MPVLALEARLRYCRNVLTLGVHPNFADYSAPEQEMIRNASKIYYPTPFYADLLNTMGIPTFPSYHTYKCVQDKIKQTALFHMLQIPHPRTRIFYGKRQQSKITDYFNFPMIAKIPRGSALGRGVFLIRNFSELAAYCQQSAVAYIQEYLALDRDIRVVVIGRQVVHAYWRLAAPKEFRTNVGRGGRISLEPIPAEALTLARETARICQWDDVGIDICQAQDQFWVLEANMKYGKEGFRQAGIDYSLMMEQLIEHGTI